METLKFKTNIKCGGCVASVTPSLNELKGISHWEVDTTNPDKILSVNTENGIKSEQVVEAIKSKGYTAVLI